MRGACWQFLIFVVYEQYAALIFDQSIRDVSAKQRKQLELKEFFCQKTQRLAHCRKPIQFLLLSDDLNAVNIIMLQIRALRTTNDSLRITIVWTGLFFGRTSTPGDPEVVKITKLSFLLTISLISCSHFFSLVFIFPPSL